MILPQLIPHENNHNTTEITLPAEIQAEVHKTLQMMLPRPIIDALIRYFVADVNW